MHNNRQNWLNKCFDWKNKWVSCLDEYKKDDSNGINIYYFLDKLSELSKENDTFVCDAGSAFYTVFQGLKVKKGQRIISSGMAEMGYNLPASIGVSFAKNKGSVICITGDGSLQTNIQELQTIIHYKLPIKIFVFNNNGYLSLRATQKKFYEGRIIGTDKNSGVSFPEIRKIANAYEIGYLKIEYLHQIEYTIIKVLDLNEPVICEVFTPPDQEIIPTVAFGKPLYQMYPFLSDEELKEELIIKNKI